MEEIQPIENQQVEKPKRFYPKNRIKWDEAKKKAVVILRDDGGMSFSTIAKLLNETDKRNSIYIYEHNKDRFSCSRGTNIIHEEEQGVGVGTPTTEANEVKSL